MKAASIDPRSPGCAGLTRTPILIKQTGEVTKDSDTDIDNKEDVAAPTRGMATFTGKLSKQMDLVEATEINASNTEVCAYSWGGGTETAPLYKNSIKISG